MRACTPKVYPRVRRVLPAEKKRAVKSTQADTSTGTIFRGRGFQGFAPRFFLRIHSGQHGARDLELLHQPGRQRGREFAPAARRPPGPGDVVALVEQQTAAARLPFVAGALQLIAQPALRPRLLLRGRRHGEHREGLGVAAHVDGIVAFTKSGENQTEVNIRPWNANDSTAYRFSEGPFRNLTVGGGVNDRGKAIVGVKAPSSPADPDQRVQIFKGNACHLVNAMVGYDFKPQRKSSLRAQLNIETLLDHGELPVLASNYGISQPPLNSGTFNKWYYHLEPRRYSLSVTLGFRPSAPDARLPISSRDTYSHTVTY